MKIWGRISDTGKYSIPLQPVLWIDGSKKENEFPQVAVTLKLVVCIQNNFRMN